VATIIEMVEWTYTATHITKQRRYYHRTNKKDRKYYNEGSIKRNYIVNKMEDSCQQTVRRNNMLLSNTTEYKKYVNNTKINS
jgi:hypothetical protein